MSNIAKKYSKYQKYLKYLLIIYPNIQTKSHYTLSLGILTYVIQICMSYNILFTVFEKFKVYNEFKILKIILMGYPNPNRTPKDPNRTQTRTET